MSAIAIIHFEDKKQPFLHLGIDEHGFIVSCKPLGDWLWKNRQVIKVKELKPGDTVNYKEDGNFQSTMYPVKSIEIL